MLLMPKINDLNLKNWKERIIAIYGDRYKIRKTYDIDDFGIGNYSYEVSDENGNFLHYFGGIENLTILKNYIKVSLYKGIFKQK